MNIIEKFKHIEDKGDLIMGINPLTPAAEAVERVKEFNRREDNSTLRPVFAAREELLRRTGYNPEGFTYFTGEIRLPWETEKEMVIRTAIFFPPGVEFVVVRGEVTGGIKAGRSHCGSIEIGCFSARTYKFDPNHYTVFIRERPKQLKAPLK